MSSGATALSEAYISPAVPFSQDFVPSATIKSTAINILCNTLGGALLVLPTAFCHASLVIGVVMTIGVASIATLSMALIVLCAEKVQCFTYKEIAERAVSLRFGKFTSGVICLYTFGCLCYYARIITDSMPRAAKHLFKAQGILVQPYFWLMLAFVFWFILSSMKNLSQLRFSSMMGVFVILYITVILIVRFFDGDYEAPGQIGIVNSDVTYLEFTWLLPRAIPVYFAAFSCHYNVPAYYKELKVRTLRQFTYSALLSLPIVAILYIAIGIIGVLTFGSAHIESTEGDVTRAFADDDIPANIGRICLFIQFCSVYPIVALGCRRTLNNLLFGDPNQSQKTFIFESFAICSSSCTIGYFIPGISPVVEIIGSLLGMHIMLTIPALMFLRLYHFSPKKNKQHNAKKEFSTPNDSPTTILPPMADSRGAPAISMLFFENCEPSPGSAQLSPKENQINYVNASAEISESNTDKISKNNNDEGGQHAPLPFPNATSFEAPSNHSTASPQNHDPSRHPIATHSSQALDGFSPDEEDGDHAGITERTSLLGTPAIASVKVDQRKVSSCSILTADMSPITAFQHRPAKWIFGAAWFCGGLGIALSILSFTVTMYHLISGK